MTIEARPPGRASAATGSSPAAARSSPAAAGAGAAGTSPDLAGLPAIIWEADAVAHRMTYVSPRAKDILGFDPVTWLRTPHFWEDHVHPDDLRAAMAAADRAISSLSAVRIQYRFQDAEGTWRWFQDAIQVVKDGRGGRRLAGVMIDITHEHDALAALTRAQAGETADAEAAVLSARLHEAIISDVDAGICYVDANRRISFWNRGAQVLTGLTAHDVLARTCQSRRTCFESEDGSSICSTDCPLTATLDTGRPRELIAWMRRADGTRFPAQVATAPIRSGEGSVTVGVVQIFTDATELIRTRREAEEARRDALWDPLTGLPNRGVLDIVLASRMGDLNRYERPFGMLVIGLEQIEVIRRRFGRSTHDEALRHAAGIVAKTIRGGDTLVRWGPDAFAVVAINADAVGLRRLADRLLRLMQSHPVRVSGVIVPVRMAVGGTLARKGEPVDRLTHRSEEAMRTALAAGNGRFVLLDGAAATGPRMLGAHRA